MSQIYKLSWDEVFQRIKKYDKSKKYFGIPRGGNIVAGLIGNPTMDISEADYIIDDIFDSGATAKKYEKYNKPMLFLYDKRKEFYNTWIEFPWEETAEKEVEENVIRILESLGEDCNREGLKDTPKRYIKFLNEFTKPKEFNLTTFDSEDYDEMIIESNIPFYSLCEHHLLPFFGHAAIAYIPGNKRIVGLSKLPRILDKFSNGFQNQERITNQIVDFLQRNLNPKGIAVSLSARHMCMELRGVKKNNVYTTTSKLTGVFRTDASCRNEFLHLRKI